MLFYFFGMSSGASQFFLPPGHFLILFGDISIKIVSKEIIDSFLSETLTNEMGFITRHLWIDLWHKRGTNRKQVLQFKDVIFLKNKIEPVPQ